VPRSRSRRLGERAGNRTTIPQLFSPPIPTALFPADLLTFRRQNSELALQYRCIGVFGRYLTRMSTGSVTWGFLGSLRARLLSWNRLPLPPWGKQGLVTQHSWQSHSVLCSLGGRKGINQLLILRECTVKELVSAGGSRQSSGVTAVSHRLVYSYAMTFCLLQSLFSVKLKARMIMWRFRKNAMLACLEALHELFYLQLGHAPPPTNLFVTPRLFFFQRAERYSCKIVK